MRIRDECEGCSSRETPARALGPGKDGSITKIARAYEWWLDDHEKSREHYALAASACRARPDARGARRVSIALGKTRTPSPSKRGVSSSPIRSRRRCSFTRRA